MSPQERFEIVYADVTGEAVESLPQFRCKAIDSYLDPKMSRAYLFFKAADERAEKMERCLDDLTDYMNSGCICGRAPDPKNPVDPRLLRKPRRPQVAVEKASALLQRAERAEQALREIAETPIQPQGIKLQALSLRSRAALALGAAQ